jgi:hypothetical protein
MEPLTHAVAAKIQEQIERTVHLIGLVSHDRADWQPPIAGAWTVGQLLGHMLDCLAGFCAVLYTARPSELAHFLELRQLPVNQACGPDEACRRMEQYRRYLDQGFAILTDADLARSIPTFFVPEGELVLTLLLGNLEHLVNHKHQLFMYLKLCGIAIGTPDLYQFRA